MTGARLLDGPRHYGMTGQGVADAAMALLAR